MTSYTGFSWTRDVELLEKHNSYPEKKKLLEKKMNKATKRKKEKKHKKDTRKFQRPVSSDCESSGGGESEWVEKSSGRSSSPSPRPLDAGFEHKLQRDRWMEDPSIDDIISTVSRKQFPHRNHGSEVKVGTRAAIDDQPGQHSRELNPYWKDGGCGLPPSPSSTASAGRHNLGSGGGGDGAEVRLMDADGRHRLQPAMEHGVRHGVRAALCKGTNRQPERSARTCPGFMKPQSVADARNQLQAVGFLVPSTGARGVSVGCRDVTGVGGSARGWKRSACGGVDGQNPAPRDGGVDDDEAPDVVKAPVSAGSSVSAVSSVSAGSSADIDPAQDGAHQEGSAPMALTQNDLNALGAKIIRAELMGDTDLADKLKVEMETARKTQQQPTFVTGLPSHNAGAEDEMVLLTRTGRMGTVRPVEQSDKKSRKMRLANIPGRRGERGYPFAGDDDDGLELNEMVRRERLGTSDEPNLELMCLAAKSFERSSDDFNVDDMILSHTSRLPSASQMEDKDRMAAIFEHRKMSAAMEKCNLCLRKVARHLIIAIGSQVYLRLPAHRSMTPGHCLLVPRQHVTSSTCLDEDVWMEMQMFRKQLVQMFRSMDKDVVFMETSMRLRHFPHMALECIPLDRELAETAPIYFKKAMQDAGPEWSQNKKIVDLSSKDVRKSIPRGFPYASVDFGLHGGFAHVIEDEARFPAYFLREIVGGMLDADPSLWRKPRSEGFEDQRCKVLEFESWWKPFDIAV